MSNTIYLITFFWQVKIWFQNRRAKDRKQQRKRDEMLKKEKKDNTTAVVVTSHTGPSGSLLSASATTPGVLVSGGGALTAASLLGNSCNNSLVTSGSTIHHHTTQTQGHAHLPSSHLVSVVAPSRGFSNPNHHSSLHSPPMGTIISNGYRDMLSASMGQLTSTTPTVVAEMAR